MILVSLGKLHKKLPIAEFIIIYFAAIVKIAIF